MRRIVSSLLVLVLGCPATLEQDNYGGSRVEKARELFQETRGFPGLSACDNPRAVVGLDEKTFENKCGRCGPNQCQGVSQCPKRLRKHYGCAASCQPVECKIEAPGCGRVIPYIYVHENAGAIENAIGHEALHYFADCSGLDQRYMLNGDRQHCDCRLWGEDGLNRIVGTGVIQRCDGAIDGCNF